MKLILCGDVMTGRGIDQIMRHPSDPKLFEDYIKTATGYVDLAEAIHGPIHKPVQSDYIWGDALEWLRHAEVDARIINLETSVTYSRTSWPKGVNYKMNPKNVPCLTAAKIDCCCLANNHVLDWGYEGLVETLEALERAGLAVAGAGRDVTRAETPAVLNIGDKSRLIAFAFGSTTSGIPAEWAAASHQPGVNLLPDLSWTTAERIAARVHALKRSGDVVVASIHWGENFGYRIPAEQRSFAHYLIDIAGIDVVQGHSSHHAKAAEVHRGKLVLYGCGDFLNDYEGISGHEAFRGDLVLMYLPTVDTSGQLLDLMMVPFQLRHLRLNRAGVDDVEWLRRKLSGQGAHYGTRVERTAEDALQLVW